MAIYAFVGAAMVASVLLPGGEIQFDVTVLDVGGSGLPGAEVELARLDPASGSEEPIGSTNSSARGHAMLSADAPGFFLISAELLPLIPTTVGPIFVPEAMDPGTSVVSVNIVLNLANDFSVNGVPLDLSHPRPEGNSAEEVTPEQLDDLRELVLRNRLAVYRNEDGAGAFCLSVEDESHERQLARPWDSKAPTERLLQRFIEYRVEPVSWCRENGGRLISAGPIVAATGRFALVWSFAWMGKGVGHGAQCLHIATRDDAGWKLSEECAIGGVFN